MSRPKPSHRSTEREGVEADGDGIMEDNDNNQDNEAAAVPLPAAVAAALVRRFRRSPRHAPNSDHNTSRSGDAPNDPGTDSSSKRKRKIDASSSSSPKLSRINRASSSAAAADSRPAPDDALSSSTQKSTNSLDGDVLRKSQSLSGSYTKDEAASNNNKNINAMKNSHDECKDNVLEAFCRMLSQGAPQQSPGESERRPPPIDVHKAANVLEAAAGRLALAVNLYWDDYFASLNHHGTEDKAAASAASPAGDPPLEENDRKPSAVNPARKVRFSKTCKGKQTEAARDGESSPEIEWAEDNNADEDERKQPSHRRNPGERGRPRSNDDGICGPRRLRRSLDPDFRAADQGEDNPSEEEFRRGQDADEEMLDTDNEGHNNPLEEESSENEENEAQRDDDRGANLFKGAINDGDASISESDEEAPGRSARTRLGQEVRASAIRSHPMAMQTKIREAAAAISRKVLNGLEAPDDSKKHRKPTDGDIASLNDNSDDYISDSDWLESHKTSTLDLLWGNGGPPASRTSTRVRNDENTINNNAVGRANPINVEEDESESVDAVEEDSHGLGIPYTWLNHGFHLSECGTGLVVKTPTAEDISFLAWRQRNLGTQRNDLPPPIHCMGITSILSLVTSLLYSGATIQGDVITCSSAQKPWSHLTLEERKNQFDDRLTDALSALVFLAAKASQKRKQRALRLLQNRMAASPEKPSAEDMEKLKTMTSRINLVPTCIWEENFATALVPRTLDGPAFCHARIKTSLTNIKDIKLYVLSTIRSFTSKGGIALLLETLVRIHGIHVINRQMRRVHEHRVGRNPQTSLLSQADQQKIPGTGDGCNLVRCTCEERQKEVLGGKALPSSIRNDPSRLIQKLTPPGNDCVFDGLLCLLLCGEVKPSWNDCVPKGLGVGLLMGISLTDKRHETSLALSRPERPVWMLKGPTCYSTLFMKEGKDFNVDTIAKIDKAQSPIQLCHWNAWYGQTHKSELLIITGAQDQATINLEQKLSKVENQLELKPPTSDRINLECSRRRLINAISTVQHQFVQKRMSEDIVETAEICRLKIHPQDEMLYPNKRQMWRFDMGEDENESFDQKPRAQRWTPYHRLNEREKRIVELKHGPKINDIIWTRWPAARIDRFTNDPAV
jgi:hypothetical protein